jgi:hypothetical protein
MSVSTTVSTRLLASAAAPAPDGRFPRAAAAWSLAPASPGDKLVGDKFLGEKLVGEEVIVEMQR